ncbi:DUF1566 domain-containing protein [Desulfovibrio inopinatus]|uniref:Lcl C-terminal domain-containing protein n=1 Tax=Desulfovibrio inopinatus TaxID=102109 RepID=UPI003CCC10BE
MFCVLSSVLVLALPVRAEYLVQGETIVDTSTNLIWMQADGGVQLDWQGALAYCENLSLAGEDDWRLPNVKELESIVDWNRLDPSIDPVFSSPSSFFWSSTRSDRYHVWLLDFYYGYVCEGGIKGAYKTYVRCVRSDS